MGRTPAWLFLSVLTPVLLALPVATPATAAPRPVAPALQQVPLDAVDVAAAQELGERPGTTAVPGSRRTVALTGKRATEDFQLVGVTWEDAPGAGPVEVSVRTRTDGRWSDWTSMGGRMDEEPDAAAPEARSARTGTAPLFVGSSDGVQARVEVTAGEAPSGLRLELLDPGTSPADVGPKTPASTAGASAARPVIRSRAEWGADESIRSSSPAYSSTLKAATIHHTASSNSYTAAQVPGLIRGFYAYHVQSLGWSDIGYNVLVDKFGTAWEGRAGGLDRPVIGAHAGGFNTGTVGVSMIGTYSSVAPPAALQSTVAKVVGWKLGLHGADPAGRVQLTSGGSTRYAAGTVVTLPAVFGHREVSTTDCPGNSGMAALPAIRNQASAAIAAGAVTGPVSTSTPSTATTDLAGRTSGGSASWRQLADGRMTVPLNLGGAVLGTPAVGSRGASSLAVVARGSDDGLWATGREGDGSWSDWSPLGSSATSRPAVAGRGDGRLDVVVRSATGSLRHGWSFAPGQWSWEDLGGAVLPGAGPATAWTSSGRYEVVVVGTDRQVWRRAWAPATGWTDWRPLGGTTSDDLGAAPSGPDSLVVAARGTDQAGWLRTVDAAARGGWVPLGGGLVGGPAASTPPGAGPQVLVRGTDGGLYRNVLSGTAWSGWRRVG